MDTKISNIVQSLIKRHDLQAVILYGSYARGDFTSTSDLDLFGIKEQTENYTVTDIVEGIQLDLWVSSFSSLSNLNEHLKLQGGLVIHDENDLASNLLKEVECYYQQGPQPLSSHEKEHIVSWINKMIKRSEYNDIESNYRRGWLLNDLLRYYFELRNKWYLGPKRAFQILKAEDFETYKSYEECLNEPKNLKLIRNLSFRVTNINY